MEIFTIKTTKRGRCPSCGKKWKVTVRRKDWRAFKGGMRSEDAFPYLSPVQRELLASGICESCWDAVFSDDEEND